METNLSITDLALCIGQEVEITHKATGIKHYSVMEGIHQGHQLIVSGGLIWGLALYDIKPVLRPLSSMTEEEKNELDELRIILRMGNMPIRVVNAYETRFYFSKGIDCLNWIESDLAIRKEE